MRAHPEGRKIHKMQKKSKYQKMYFGKNMSFWKVWFKTDSSMAFMGSFLGILWDLKIQKIWNAYKIYKCIFSKMCHVA